MHTLAVRLAAFVDMSLTEVCHTYFPDALTPRWKHPHINGVHWRDDIENSQWLEIFCSFTAVKDFYLYLGFALRVALALQKPVGHRVNEVLSSLRARERFFQKRLSGPIGSR
jgi:hypothetical protein